MSDDAFLYREEHGEIEEPRFIDQFTVPELVAELVKRDEVEWYQIERDQQFNFSINYCPVDFTKHMPRSKLLIIDEEE